jgi:hypothetical protein
VIEVTCKKCKQEVVVPFYFYDVRILTEDNPTTMVRTYTASACGKAICPLCGNDLREWFSCPISQDDIIELATKRCVKPYSRGRE